ncbi:DEAD/DEAH box helicase family protein [Halobaculum lipolyticum]|uniref:DNA 3'-5' helicase n=1 Tax=Halobaculum lipolyticum TaxID=3032001 RepID=A0ABD5WCS1_9EURY|nr:DEAD/DEAH box helicase family protein [Halobaculum sp. DT31]
MPPATLTYEDGTVRVADAPDEPLPGVESDARSGVRRAPAHRYREIRDTLRRRGVDVDDRVLDPADLPPLSSGYTLRDYQREALDAWTDADRRGVLELPTGSGKTVIALEAIARGGEPALVVVPTVDLLDQWQRELASTFDVPVGRLGGGEQTVEAVTVATYDSAYLRADELGDRFGLLVFDEVHHLGGEGYRDIARLFAAPARLGLTATFERPDGAHETVADLVGPVVYALDADDLAGEHLADYEVRRVEVELSDAERERYEAAQGTFVDYVRDAGITFRSGADYQELVKRSGNDPRAREALLAKQRAREVMMNADAKLDELGRILDRHRGERVIVFTAHTALVYRISERFLIPAITAETGVEERRETLARFREGTYSRVVAANVLDEGVDVPEASVGVILSGSGSEREFTQRLGRVLRPGADGTKTATLYELVTSETAEERVARRRR